MKKRMMRMAAIMIAFAVTFICLPALAGEYSYAAAAKKPTKVTGVSAKAGDAEDITIKWDKLSKNVKGYVILRDGKSIAKVGKSVTSYKDKGLALGKSYTYKVKAYNSYKQYYNSKTKKWVNKKPKKSEWKGRKKRTKTVYGKASAAVRAEALGGFDEKFANWKFENQSIQMPDGYISYNARFDAESKGKVTWQVDGNATIRAAMRSVVVTFNSTGIFKLTATNYDGQVKSATITVIKNVPITEFTFRDGYEPPSVIYKRTNYFVLTNCPQDCDVEWSVDGDDCVDIKPGKGALTITAADEPGTATITGTLNLPNGSEYDGNRTVSFTVRNDLFPREADGSITITRYTEPSYWSQPILMGGIVTPEQDLWSLPSGTIINLNIDDYKTMYTGPMGAGVIHISVGATYGIYGITGLLTPDGKIKKGEDILFFADPTLDDYNPYDGNRMFSFMKSGEVVLETSGRELTFRITGENERVVAYSDFISSWVRSVGELTDLEKANKAVELAHSYQYGNIQEGIELVLYGYGDCWAGADLAVNLIRAAGIPAVSFYAWEYETSGLSASHRNVAIKINNQVYLADATPGHMNESFKEWQSDIAPPPL